MNNPAFCDCCTCSRVCPGHVNLTCVRIPYEFVGVNLTSQSWVDQDLEADLEACGPTGHRMGGTNYLKHHKRYHESTTGTVAYYEGGVYAPICQMSGYALYTSLPVNDPDGATSTLFECDGTATHTLYGFNERGEYGHQTAFTWAIRFLPDGDVDCYALASAWMKIGDWIYNYGNIVYFYGRIAPPEGWIDPATGAITEALAIPNQLGTIGNIWRPSDYGVWQPPTGPDCFAYDRYRIGGCGGEVIIHPDDASFPAGWRTADRDTYQAGAASCGAMEANPCPDGPPPPVDPPDDGGEPPPPPPWEPPGEGEETRQWWVPLRTCDTDSLTGLWAWADILRGPVVRHEGECLKADYDGMIRRRRAPGITVWPSTFFETCSNCADAPPGCVQYLGNVTPAINSANTASFGESFPAGTYRIYYRRGALRYAADQQWSINVDYLTVGYFLRYNNDTAGVRAPGITGVGEYASQADAEADHADEYFDFVHTGGSIGVAFEDSPYDDNVSGSPNPTFTLCGPGDGGLP